MASTLSDEAQKTPPVIDWKWVQETDTLFPLLDKSTSVEKSQPFILKVFEKLHQLPFKTPAENPLLLCKPLFQACNPAVWPHDSVQCKVLEKFISFLITDNRKVLEELKVPQSWYSIKRPRSFSMSSVVTLLFLNAVHQNNDRLGKLLLDHTASIGLFSQRTKLRANEKPLDRFEKRAQKYARLIEPVIGANVLSYDKSILKYPLHSACAKGLIKVSKKLLRAQLGFSLIDSFDPNALNEEKKPPLSIACDSLTSFLSKARTDLLTASGVYSSTDINEQYRRGRIIEELLDQKADPNLANKDGALQRLFLHPFLPEELKVQYLEQCRFSLEEPIRQSFLDCAIAKKEYSFAAELIARGASFNFFRNLPTLQSDGLPTSLSFADTKEILVKLMFNHQPMGHTIEKLYSLLTREELVEVIQKILKSKPPFPPSETTFQNLACFFQHCINLAIALPSPDGKGLKQPLYYTLVSNENDPGHGYLHKLIYYLLKNNPKDKSLHYNGEYIVDHVFTRDEVDVVLALDLLDIHCPCSHACLEKTILRLLGMYQNPLALKLALVLYFKGLPMELADICINNIILSGRRDAFDFLRDPKSRSSYLACLLPYLSISPIKEAQSIFFYSILQRQNENKKHDFYLLSRILKYIPEITPMEDILQSGQQEHLFNYATLDALFLNPTENKRKCILELLQKGAIFNLNEEHVQVFLKKRHKSALSISVATLLYNNCISTLKKNQAKTLLEHCVRENDFLGLTAFFQRNSRFRNNVDFLRCILAESQVAEQFLQQIDKHDLLHILTLWDSSGCALIECDDLAPLLKKVCIERSITWTSFAQNYPSSTHSLKLSSTWLRAPKNTSLYKPISKEYYQARLLWLRREVLHLWDGITAHHNSSPSLLNEPFLQAIASIDNLPTCYSPEQIRRGLVSVFDAAKKQSDLEGTHSDIDSRHLEYSSFFQDFEQATYELIRLNNPLVTAKHLIYIARCALEKKSFLSYRAQAYHSRIQLESQAQGMDVSLDCKLSYALEELIETCCTKGFYSADDAQFIHYRHEAGLLPIGIPSTIALPSSPRWTDDWFVPQFLNILESYIPPSSISNLLKKQTPPEYDFALVKQRNYFAFKENNIYHEIMRLLRGLKLKRTERKGAFRAITEAKGNSIEWEEIDAIKKIYERKIVELAHEMPILQFNLRVHGRPSLACEELRQSSYIQILTPRNRLLSLIAPLCFSTQNQISIEQK